jgi:hypothetical protein
VLAGPQLARTAAARGDEEDRLLVGTREGDHPTVRRPGGLCVVRELRQPAHQTPLAVHDHETRPTLERDAATIGRPREALL